MAITLFTPPVQYQDTQPFAFQHPHARTAALGGIFEDLIKGVTDVVDTVTGAKTQREAQKRSIELAKLQADAAQAETEARAAAWKSAIPWIAVGVGAIGLAVVMMASSKK